MGCDDRGLNAVSIFLRLPNQWHEYFSKYILSGDWFILLKARMFYRSGFHVNKIP